MTESPTQRRRERERAERRQLIVDSARELAEAEGWDAVTTRRLADTIEYSQPVLYSHFANRAAIVDAVVVEGAAELASTLRAARAGTEDDAATAVAQAYLDFAAAHPALYDAIFTMPSGLPFGTPDAPPALQDAFGELRLAFAPSARGTEAEVLTEVVWSALHGLASLVRSGRLRPDLHDARLTRLLALVKSRS
ncbi:TetR family transcriptional regulator [Luteimicrobium album]|uniref:TetR family transcriptional regulator n=1 Tax=Luteimicrobium album TaxID=1054550 RepID=A0ABQ6I0S5_9MICO|nr:TetR/AcrR family transcriptional regulator [Luteimicrobium album]GMA23564.1 TetR family transcriptional regulator [Luteimicrobium album]